MVTADPQMVAAVTVSALLLVRRGFQRFSSGSQIPAKDTTKIQQPELLAQLMALKQSVEEIEKAQSKLQESYNKLTEEYTRIKRGLDDPHSEAPSSKRQEVSAQNKINVEVDLTADSDDSLDDEQEDGE